MNTWSMKDDERVNQAGECLTNEELDTVDHPCLKQQVDGGIVKPLSSYAVFDCNHAKQRMPENDSYQRMDKALQALRKNMGELVILNVELMEKMMKMQTIVEGLKQERLELMLDQYKAHLFDKKVQRFSATQNSNTRKFSSNSFKAEFSLHANNRDLAKAGDSRHFVKGEVINHVTMYDVDTRKVDDDKCYREEANEIKQLETNTASQSLVDMDFNTGTNISTDTTNQRQVTSSFCDALKLLSTVGKPCAITDTAPSQREYIYPSISSIHSGNSSLRSYSSSVNTDLDDDNDCFDNNVPCSADSGIDLDFDLPHRFSFMMAATSTL